jgi:hypothetical protein
VSLPSGAIILDSVGWTDGGAEDVVLNGVALVPATATDAPDVAVRIRGNTAANNAAAWYYGNMSNATTINPTGASANLPAGAIITPGNPNYRVAVPLVQSVRVNDGSAQRSRVTQLVVTFDSIVTFVGAPAAAFTLTRTGGGAVTLTAAPVNTSGVTVVTLTFTGAETQFGSLVDGNYTLTILGNQVQNGSGFLDGDNNGTAGGDYTMTPGQGLYRLFGDQDGDRDVDGVDLFRFRTAFGTTTGNPAYIAALDFEGDGDVDGADLFQFRLRFATVLAP